MSRLVAHRTKHEHRSYVCPHCSFAFYTEISFNNHFPDCSKHARQVIQFPDEDHNELFWISRAKTAAYPMVVYADFESTLLPVGGEKTPGTTHAIREHVPSGFCMYIVSRYSLDGVKPEEFEPLLYSGLNALDVFNNQLILIH